MSALHTYSKNNKVSFANTRNNNGLPLRCIFPFFLDLWQFGFSLDFLVFHKINKNEVVCYDFFRRGCLAPAGGEYARLTSLLERGRGLAMETLRGKFKPFNIYL